MNIIDTPVSEITLIAKHRNYGLTTSKRELKVWNFHEESSCSLEAWIVVTFDGAELSYPIGHPNLNFVGLDYIEKHPADTTQPCLQQCAAAMTMTRTLIICLPNWHQIFGRNVPDSQDDHGPCAKTKVTLCGLLSETSLPTKKAIFIHPACSRP